MERAYACPICNGFASDLLICPNCGTSGADYGPISYLLSDYSPYRPVDDFKKNDGWIDLQNHCRPHQIYCPNCGWTDVILYKETPI